MSRSSFGVVLVICISLFGQSCNEVGPDINLHGNPNAVSDTTYIESPVQTPEAKNVLMEDFSGVQCPNCPEGDQIITTEQATYSGRVSAIVYHPINIFGTPYPFSQQNLENSVSQTLYENYFTPGSGGEPAGAIDRQLFSGQSNLLLDHTIWSGYVTQEIALTPQVNINLSKIYSSSSRVLQVIAEIHYTQNVAQPNNITIALTEDSIVTAQQNGPVIDTFYVHDGVFRAFLTNAEGDRLNDTLQAGRVIRNIYVDTLSTAWNAAHMNVIAFVHEFQNSKTVYQVKQVSVSP